jgi:hypothetical protein
MVFVSLAMERKAVPSGNRLELVATWTTGFAQKRVWLTKKCGCQTHAAQNQY